MIQLIIVLLIALILSIFSGYKNAISALLAGVTALLPSLFFARSLFRHSGAHSARAIVKSFYVGEALKIVTSIFLFTAVFIFFRVNPLVFFVTYIVVVLTHWFSPLIIDTKRDRPKSD